MSRSNHYIICEECTVDVPCGRHKPWSYTAWNKQTVYVTYLKHKPARVIAARRTWERKGRWPQWSPGIHHSRPPRWWWQNQHAKARRIFSQMMRRSDDPALPAEKELIDLYGWY
jgi:hypothetical protein